MWNEDRVIPVSARRSLRVECPLMRRLPPSPAITIPFCLSVAAVFAVWMVSFAHPMHVAFTHHSEHCRAWVSSGRAGVDNEPEVTLEAAKRELDLRAMSLLATTGLDLMAPPPSRVPARWSRSSALALPAVIVLLMTLLILPSPIRWIAQRIRASSHRCLTCSYNLTGNT